MQEYYLGQFVKFIHIYRLLRIIYFIVPNIELDQVILSYYENYFSYIKLLIELNVLTFVIKIYQFHRLKDFLIYKI